MKLLLLILLALPVSPTSPALFALSAPSNLKGGSVSQTQINLNWTDNSAKETGFQVFMSQDGTDFNQLKELPKNSVRYPAVGLLPSTRYWFKVRAVNRSTKSAFSNTVSAQTNAGETTPTATPTATPPLSTPTPTPAPSISPSPTPSSTPTPTPTPPPPTPTVSPSPSGAGIASKYPGDKGIENDPAVIMADDFEAYNVQTDMAVKWKVVWGRYMVISTTQHFAGAKSVEMALPVTTTEIGMSIEKLLASPVTILYFRAYQKWDAGYTVDSSNHNGLSTNGGKSGGAGTTPQGDDWFSMIVQSNNIKGEAPPGWLHEYVYWPHMSGGYGDHWYPDGTGFPWKQNPAAYPDFKPRPNIIPQRDRWYCYEQMVRINTVGKNDGEVKVWVDGALVADWTNLEIRKADALKIDRAFLCLHAIKSARINKKWYDNAVIATEYIGPMAPVTKERKKN